MGIDTWDEVRTAWMVARAGTVSGAAEALGVHHATVIRHVDALEARLGVKLFQRHPRGYTPTEAGEALAQVGAITDERFAQLAARLAGLDASIEGDLIITTLPESATIFMGALAELRVQYPGLRIRLRTDARVLRLEYGEAHVAIRAGARPEEPDSVVQPLHAAEVGIYASPEYIARKGRPMSDSDLPDHDWVGSDDDQFRAPFAQWLRRHEWRPHYTFRSDSSIAQTDAIRSGLGLGFIIRSRAEALEGLVEVMPPRAEWSVPLWLVTHVDLHRTPKVQAVLAALKKACAV